MQSFIKREIMTENETSITYKKSYYAFFANILKYTSREVRHDKPEIVRRYQWSGEKNACFI